MTAPDTYNVRDLVGIELVDADPSDVRAVDRQLGPLRGPLPPGPTLTIRFVDRLNTRPLRLTGINESGHDGEQFVVLRSSHKVPTRVAIPLEAVGASLEITAEHGLPAVPLLIPIINLTILAGGVVPLHAAAFVLDGRGILITGWSKGGKTETLLAFLAHGATYLGDEWIYVRPDGTMDGIPEPIRIWQWHLDQLDQVRRRIPPADRARLAAVGLAHRGLRHLPVGRLRRAAALLAKQRYADVPPLRFIDNASVARGRIAIDTVVLVGTHASPATRVSPITADDVARRMVHSLAYERRELAARAYEMRFGASRGTSTMIDAAERLELDGLRAALAGRRVLALEHPYPVEIDGLYRALAPILSGPS